MKIAIGNDHAGVEVKRKIESYLSQKGHTVITVSYTHLTLPTILLV